MRLYKLNFYFKTIIGQIKVWKPCKKKSTVSKEESTCFKYQLKITVPRYRITTLLDEFKSTEYTLKQNPYWINIFYIEKSFSTKAEGNQFIGNIKSILKKINIPDLLLEGDLPDTEGIVTIKYKD
jgi:hypothetical protein